MRGSSAGLEDVLASGKSPVHYAFLTTLDSLFSCVIVAPCVVGFWKSEWSLMDFYVTPENPTLSAAISTAIGIFGHIFFMVAQKLFETHFHPDRSRLVYYLVSRIYTLCYAFICVNGWRGPWQLLQLHTSSELSSLIAITVVGAVALLAIRGFRNVSATPFAIVTDSVKGYFEVVTMFRVSIRQNTLLYILDCLFSVLIVGTLVVFVWRGAWVLVDVFVFPEDEVKSAWASLVIGYAATGIAFILQPLMRWICDRVTGVVRLIIADIFILFSLFGTINVWRGIWNLTDLYFLPENPELSCWITHIVCLVLLILLGCSNSLLVRGVYIDAEEPAGKCVVFPVYYLRIIFQQERMKKLNAKLQFETIKKELDKFETNHIVAIDNTIVENHKENL